MVSKKVVKSVASVMMVISMAFLCSVEVILPGFANFLVLFVGITIFAISAFVYRFVYREEKYLEYVTIRRNLERQWTENILYS